MNYYYDLYTGKGRITDSEPYISLYKENKNKILREYSFKNKSEFFADSYAYYFHKNIAKTNKLSSTFASKWKYPKELNSAIKNTISTIEKLNW